MGSKFVIFDPPRGAEALQPFDNGIFYGQFHHLTGNCIKYYAFAYTHLRNDENFVIIILRTRVKYAVKWDKCIGNGKIIPILPRHANSQWRNIG